ncbi:hypothetical protein BO221_50390 [Archangium sp. Cb G35]|uniref:hypothetical protein n=1 Tax=Archangium sp. Cb G35 TaxID=1920190 RepID=UPI00093604DC|nr:hypothetical protein [Archangium sp. Cb G35]OJT16412.1 hypothetical protein BO221_50390 [Archangium sp. Cb G35]
MADDTQPPRYDMKPAQELLTRIRHQLRPDKERVNAAGNELLDALLKLGADGIPITIVSGPDTTGEYRRVMIKVPQRHAEVVISYDRNDHTFSVWRQGRHEDVPLEYDPVRDAYVPSADVQQKAERELTALEVLIQTAWDFMAKESNQR